MVIMAVDDEKTALDELVCSIQSVVPESRVAAFRKADKALQFFYAHPCEVSFLAIQMQHVNEVAVVKQMRRIHPQVNIIFATNSDAYMKEAFALHASGYLLKPITPDKIRLELDNLRYSAAVALKKRVRFCTFGNFEVYIDEKPVKFKYDKTKELLAYLVDRHGAYANNAEIMSMLWDGKKRSSYLGNLKKRSIGYTAAERVPGCDRNRLE